MTRKDLELIIAVVHNHRSGLIGSAEQRLSLARSFSVALSAANPAFDSEKFILACTKPRTK